MSYINKNEQRLIRRRPALARKLSYAELLTRLDTQAEEGNQLIAKSESKAQHWFDIAGQLATENDELREQVAELKRQGEALEAEIERLRRKVVKKAGKRKGEEWGE